MLSSAFSKRPNLRHQTIQLVKRAESAQVSSDLAYEILNGYNSSNAENKDYYINLFSMFNKKLNLDIEKEYIIFYERDDFVDVTSLIEENKLKNSILKNGL
jgi:hypothetical protein